MPFKRVIRSGDKEYYSLTKASGETGIRRDSLKNWLREGKKPRALDVPDGFTPDFVTDPATQQLYLCKTSIEKIRLFAIRSRVR